MSDDLRAYRRSADALGRDAVTTVAIERLIVAARELATAAAIDDPHIKIRDPWVVGLEGGGLVERIH